MSFDDKESLIHLCNCVDRTYLSDRLPNPYTAADADWWLNMVAEKEGTDGIFRAIIVDGDVVGTVSVERKEDVYRFDGELGFMLLTDYWNRGVMTEAVSQICKVAFQELNLHRVSANVFSPNKPSQRVLLKNGFQQEGILRKAAVKGDRIYDVITYGLLK